MIIEKTQPNDTVRAQRGRPRSRDKHRAILDSAANLFISNGFDRTSMDEVARGAGVSKQTVYSHFAGKDQLFVAVIEGKMRDFVGDDMDQHAWQGPAHAVVFIICQQVLSLLMSPDAMAMYRMLVGGGGSDDHHHMAELFYEAGPLKIKRRIARFLEQATRRGELQVPDPEAAAYELVALLRGQMYTEATLGLRTDVTQHQIDAHARRTTDLFLKLYGPCR